MSTLRDFKVAFIGDQDMGSNALSVLRLICAEGAELVLHQEDLVYVFDPDLVDHQNNLFSVSSFPTMYLSASTTHIATGVVNPAVEIFRKDVC
jgi:hypothetical protein